MKINLSVSKSNTVVALTMEKLREENKKLREEIDRYKKQLKQFSVLLTKFEELVPVMARDEVALAKMHLDIPDPKDYLVVGDKSDTSTWHLPVSRNGVPDHHLMGGAWATLTSNYRGHEYGGPNKRAALKKLKALYKSENLPTPAE